ncbi:MAG: hypothetical protein CVT89_09045 [Candidatus Altiarchaeales archaeon HGW-Altiarchaeales-2]|nr:MAG: hypothetical protein CVT89_09045 [Candidatus Altiarchaeales archaeon HGW-Altiarchaeales-2]
MEKKFSSIGIVCNPNVVEKEKDFITDTLKAVQNFIKDTDGEILTEHTVHEAIGKFLKCKESNIKDMHCDMILVFGGDGTILHTLNAIQSVPIIGINLGRFGFMTELNKSNATEKLENLFNGNFFIENYDMLNVNDKYDAVNEAVISYKFPARLLDFKIKINNLADARIFKVDKTLNKDKNTDVIDFSADGVVIATQTGSTAEDAFLIIDGKVVEKVNAGDKISVKKSKKVAKFIRLERTMRCAKIFKF